VGWRRALNRRHYDRITRRYSTNVKEPSMKTMMKSKILFAALTFVGVLGASAVYADETVDEKAEAAGHDAARAVKKSAHRAEEATCMQSDTKCLEEKAKHRAQEASDYTRDKAKELKNTVDDDKK